MARTRRNTKETLVTATIHLVYTRGVEAATTRAIAQAAGVTEGAIYRHYRSKEELRWDAFKQILSRMIRDKQHLVTGDIPVRWKLREWIRLTYSFFDRHREAFSYVLLLPPPAPQADDPITTQQGRMFIELMRAARASRQIRDLAPELAMSHFTGVMLNVPRLINDGALPAPAWQYVDEVTDVVWRFLKPDVELSP